MGKLFQPDRMAEKAFESEAIQKSWSVHMQMFGPLLTYAFAEDAYARVQLTNALNHISQRDVKNGSKLLLSLKDRCMTDGDRAAWLFFMGICYEFSGQAKEKLYYYEAANGYRHSYYLSYLKVAKARHEMGDFDRAEENYREAIRCLEGGEMSPLERQALSSAYSNLASCLTVMHRYADAEALLNESVSVLPEFPGRDAAWAVLYAARGEEARAEACMDEMRKSMPQLYFLTAKYLGDIVNRTHPQYFARSLGVKTVGVSAEEAERAAVSAFWEWFSSEYDRTVFGSDRKETSVKTLVSELQQALMRVFPFMERSIALRLAFDPVREGTVRVTLSDYYMVALEHGFVVLLDAMPSELREKWMFDTVRFVDEE